MADLDEKSWNDTVALDLDGVMWCSQAALPALQASGGAIVNTSSLVAMAPAPGSGAYSAAKVGVALSRSTSSAMAKVDSPMGPLLLTWMV